MYYICQAGVESITISSEGQVTYCSDKNLDFTAKPELKTYVATGYDKKTGIIWLTRVLDVPAKTGFLLMGEAGDYKIPIKDGGSSYYKNMFNGTLEGKTIYATEGDYTNYYLSNGKLGIGFYKVTKPEGVPLGANRCYLPIPSQRPTAGTRSITADVDYIGISVSADVIGIRLFQGTDGTTGVYSIDNGKMIMDNDVYYNLQGQRVENPGKGLYIRNGKKVIIK